jgi:beta-N-acetylhexosaminidase
MSDPAASPGRLMMVGLPSPQLDSHTRATLERLQPGGVILFARNLDSSEQTATLIDEVRRLLPYPLLVALDQEGGRVSRLERWIGPTPTAAALARAGERSTRAFGGSTGRALGALGFNIDFAPVVDLCTEEAVNGIGDRSFGTDPHRVVSLAGAFLDGLQQTGVAGCLKHFPGLGSTCVDSHERLPTDPRGRDELEANDLIPFRRLATRAVAVMVGHGAYPSIDSEPSRPATLSPVLVRDLLRGNLGFEGLVVSDDLEMGAVAPLDRNGQAAVLAVEAGCDLILYCARLDRAERALAALVRAMDERPGFAAQVARGAAAVAAAARRGTSP